jgi:dihydrofolate reductase
MDLHPDSGNIAIETSLSRRFFGCRRQQCRAFQNIEQSILEQHEADERGPGDGNKGDEDRADLVIMGSGSIIPPLAQQGLIDEYQIVVIPVRERCSTASERN